MEFIKWANPSADFYSRLYDLLITDLEAINNMGIDYLREQLSFKDKYDFRLETALAMLDRYGVTEGELELKNLTLLTELPEKLHNDNYIKNKLLEDNKKLLAMLQYYQTKNCRRIYINEYFGFFDEPICKNCDND